MKFSIKYPVSKLAFGCEPLGGTDWGQIDLNEIRSAISFALELGINVFDVADVYGLGRAEEELSKTLGKKINDVFIITKFGVRWENESINKRARTYKDASPEYMIKALEGSLRRLKVDTIPLYLIHWPDGKTNVEDTLDALEKQKNKGKILNYGISNFFTEDTKNLFENFNVSAYQGPLNLLDYSRTDSIFKIAAQFKIKTFSYGPLAQGLLTGKFDNKTKFELNDRRYRLPHFQQDHWDLNNKILNALADISIKKNKTISQVAIRWVIDNFNIDSVIIGAKSRKQVELNIGALNFQLENSEIETLNSIIGYK